MSSDGSLPADSSRRFTRFGLASLFVLMAALAIAIAIGLELSKSEVDAYIQVARTIRPSGLPRDWFHELSDTEYDSFRRTQVELLRSKSLLTRALRDPTVSHITFLAQKHDPIDWLQKNLYIDYPNDAELLRVRLLTHEPEDGVRIVNAVVHAYFREVVERGTREDNEAERQLRALCDELTDQVIREKKDTQSLEKAFGAEAAAQSPELEVRRARTQQVEEQLNEVTRQLQRLRLGKSAEMRVRLLDEAAVSP